MDKTTESETRDFMNVESFSQLPFIRPAPPLKEKSTTGAIRLFGKEFTSSTTDDHSISSENNINNSRLHDSTKDNSDNTETSSRKFECHYCCRNFPTSQALGGHQNAHKRERQHAKRAHLQSTMMHGGLSGTHVYGLMNYSRFGSAPTLPGGYHSWNNSSYSPSSRLYGSHGSYTGREPLQQPINGSPLPMWRFQNAHSSSGYIHERALPMHQQIPLIGSPKDNHLKQPFSSSQSRFGYDSKPSMKDNVSLDLHL